VHTQYSGDSEVNIAMLPHIGRQRGLSGVGITDHNTLKGLKNAKNSIPTSYLFQALKRKLI
jgi:predicted metal-dependent phosphoesterase TrpH